VTSLPHRPPSRLRRWAHLLRQFGPAGPIALIATVLPLIGALAIAALAQPIAPWLKSHGVISLAIFILAFALLCGVALVPTYANSILAGWVFGFIIGLPAALLGLLGAAVITYAISRRLSRNRVEQLIGEHPKWQTVRHALIRQSAWRTTWIVVLVRLSPMLPFETTSVLLAVTGVPTAPFITGTALGVIPRTAVVVFIASRARALDLHHTPGRWLLVLGLLATAIAALAIALISRQALKLATEQSDTTTNK
jgi:uncharacterized membrane protein YdjX (TVP38/TMEM64 family)